MNIEELPKVELHVHLDGSLDLELAKVLSGESEEHIKDNMVANNKCVDLNDYLTKFDFSSKLLQTRDNLKACAASLANNFEKDKVIYAEVRFAPLKHISEGLSLDDVVTSVIEGFSSSKVKVNLILCMMRNDSFSDNLQVIDLAKRYLSNGVVAIDLAGAEALYPTEDFEELFAIARNKGVPYTIHAGEADGIDSINSAILFGTSRIGHGVRCIEDIQTMNTIRERGILLEVCPTSNVQTNIVDKYSEHPIKKIIDYGIKVCINTDNRTVSNINLNEEYKLLVDNCGLTIEDLIDTNINAINGSFLSDEDKDYLIKKYRTFL